MSKISVALPVFNGADFIIEAIESILIQNYEDFELVFVDNASNDETVSIVRMFAEKDSRIKLFAFDEHLGQVDNVNRVAKMCTSEWIHFFCHDDIMLQGCIKNVIDTIEKVEDNRDIALISHKPAWLFMNNIVKVPFNEINGQTIFDFKEFMQLSRLNDVDFVVHKKEETAQNIINGKGPYLPALTTAIVKKVVFDEIGRFDDKYIHFDVFLWMRLVKNYSYLELGKAFTLTRIHGNQVAVDARKSLRTIEDNKIFWKEYLKFVTNKPLIRQKLLVFLKPITVATGIITVTLIRFGFFKSLKILINLPLYWWPFIIIYFSKRYRSEMNNKKDLEQYVPVDLIYP